MDKKWLPDLWRIGDEFEYTQTEKILCGTGSSCTTTAGASRLAPLLAAPRRHGLQPFTRATSTRSARRFGEGRARRPARSVVPQRPPGQPGRARPAALRRLGWHGCGGALASTTPGRRARGRSASGSAAGRGRRSSRAVEETQRAAHGPAHAKRSAPRPPGRRAVHEPHSVSSVRRLEHEVGEGLAVQVREDTPCPHAADEYVTRGRPGSRAPAPLDAGRHRPPSGCVQRMPPAREKNPTIARSRSAEHARAGRSPCRCRTGC